jgi:hypothetical protein
MVPTVDREVRTGSLRSMAMAGGMPSIFDPGYHRYAIQRDFDVKIFQIMLPGTFYPNRLCFHCFPY